MLCLSAISCRPYIRRPRHRRSPTWPQGDGRARSREFREARPDFREFARQISLVYQWSTMANAQAALSHHPEFWTTRAKFRRGCAGLCGFTESKRFTVKWCTFFPCCERTDRWWTLGLRHGKFRTDYEPILAHIVATALLVGIAPAHTWQSSTRGILAPGMVLRLWGQPRR